MNTIKELSKLRKGINKSLLKKYGVDMNTEYLVINKYE